MVVFVLNARTGLRINKVFANQVVTQVTIQILLTFVKHVLSIVFLVQVQVIINV